jgi:pimeloyl-ACP methyl ester carboxylesterase
MNEAAWKDDMKPTTASEAASNERKRENECATACSPCSLGTQLQVSEGEQAVAHSLRLDVALRRFEQEAVHGICPTGRYRCSYFTWGSGPPIVFIHGLGDLACCYVPIISVLSRNFRCIAYEQPIGRGDGALLGRYTHADLVQDLLTLLDHLDLRQCYVLGSSFGSTIALAAMRAQPERIPRAILAGGFAQRLLSPAERLLARLAQYLPGSMRFVPLRKQILMSCLGPAGIGRPEFFEFLMRNTGSPPITAIARRAMLLRMLDLRSLLPEIRQPVLLVCGEHDTVVDRRCEEVLLQGLPHCARAELHHCGHLAHYTHPEVVAELVRRFLTPPATRQEQGP